ncbi:MAG: cyclic nucleotide-binding domain-containing protein, partial [Anaerolineales bacterium]|nr:cyclic nucleotide-binding domain-containing protein [Anaerolineales bacterium]
MKPMAQISAEQLKIFRHTVPPSLTAKAANKMLFDLLQNGKMKILDAPMEETRFTEGDIIFREGDPADACFLIQEGRVAVIVGDLDAPAAVMHRETGDIIGEMALLEKMPRSASIVALSDVTLLRIERDGFDQLIEVDPVVTRKLLMMLSHRLRSAHSMNITNVEKRLQLLTQLSQLEEENEILLEVQKARQEMVDLIVHDLRNPLANLYGTLKMLEMVLPAELLSDHQDLMSIAGLAYVRMKRLVDSLLDLRGMESGERELVLTAVDLCSLIQESVQLASFTIQKRQIDVCMRFPDERPIVLVDADMLGR